MRLTPSLQWPALVALMGLVASCGTQPAAPSTERRAPSGGSSSAAAASARGTAAAGARPALPFAADDAAAVKLWEEVDRLADPMGTFAVLAQKRPAGYRAIPASRGGRFPGAAFAEVRGFAYRFATWWNIDESAPGCGEAILARDGTLCPSAVAPGARLSPEQAERLVAIASKPDPAVANTHIRCGFEPHHAFVFYDDKGVPVAQILVCFTCGEWRLTPAPTGIGMLIGAGLGELRALCRELSLGGCFLGDDAVEEKLSAAAERLRARGEEWRASPRGGASGVDPAKRMKDLSDEERRRLCGWYAARFMGDRSTHGDQGFECEEGRSGVLMDFPACKDSVPKCDAPVGQVEACMKRVIPNLCGEPSTALADCAPVERCLWGVRWRVPPSESAARAKP